MYNILFHIILTVIIFIVQNNCIYNHFVWFERFFIVRECSYFNVNMNLIFSIIMEWVFEFFKLSRIRNNIFEIDQWETILLYLNCFQDKKYNSNLPFVHK